MEQYVKYLRKSRFDRDYSDLSLEETLKRHDSILTKLAQTRGYHVVRTYYEVVSGESIAARPEVQKLLDEVGQGIYAGVLVVDVDRLARGNSIDQGIISQTFQFSGTKIITPSKTYDPTNEYDEEYFEFGLFMSRREYKTITRRLVRGRHSSASEGKYVGSIAPYGYQKVKLDADKGFTLAPDPAEADVVRLVFEMYLNHAGTKSIANHLNNLKIPTRHGDLWTYCTIGNMICNPVYAGKIKLGWSRQHKAIKNGMVVKKVKRLKNPEEYQLFDGLHPPLVDEETFQRAQELRLSRQPTAPVKDAFELQNSFAGLIFCGKCGKRIGRTTTTRGAPRLRCVNHVNCHNSSCGYDVVERSIIDALRVWLAGYKVKIDTADFSEHLAACQIQLQQIERELDKLQGQLEKAFELVERGAYTIEVFQERRDKLTQEIAAQEARRAGVLETVQFVEQKAYQRSNIIPKTEALMESYEDMTPQERNDLLKEILMKVEYTKEPKGEVQIDLYPRLPKL